MSAKRSTAPRSAVRENVESIAWAVIMMLILRIFLLQAFRIPSESMRDTLLVGDFLFVSKLDYGAKLPFTPIRLPGLRSPRTGDVIVFQWPPDPTQDFIKRCIATGGQTVEIREKHVFVDGRELSEKYVRHTDNRGFVPMGLVKGRAVFIYFSTASTHWWDMPFFVRWDRLFRAIR